MLSRPPLAGVVVPGWRTFASVKSLIEIWSYRNLIWNLSQRELRARYKKSILGWAWSLINPAAMLGIYTLVFGLFLKQTPPPSGSGNASVYAMYLFAGLVVWNFFSSTVNGAIVALQTSGGLLNKVYFPPAAPAIANTFTTLLQFVIESSILMIIMIALGNVSATFLLFPLLMVCLTLFSLGLGLFLSVFNVRFRDVSYLVGIAMQLLFYATPIIYPLVLVQQNAPKAVYTMVRLNPLTQFVEWSRDAFYTLRWPDWPSLLGAIAASVFTFVLGWWVFINKTRDIAEEL
jgi:ABC-type polysaccharide/polyol phosphate export permease